MTLDENALVALLVAGAVVLWLALRGGHAHTFFTVGTLVYGALTVAAWYTDWPLAFQYWSMLALLAVATGVSAWRWYGTRARPGWWGGAHERIEQT